MIGDGRSLTGLSLQAWLGSEPVRKMSAQLHRRPPALDVVAEDAPPVPALVNWGTWKAKCPNPDCTGAADVWREGPHLVWCWACGNALVGGAWLRVVMPADADAIEAELSSVPMVQRRNWRPPKET